MGDVGRSVTAALAGLALVLGLVVGITHESSARRGQAEITAPASPEDITLDPRVHEIAKELRCPICQGLSVADSPTELATQMRGLIAERLEAGESPEEIEAYFASKYGDWILLRPKRQGITWLVWLLPVAGLLAGGVVIVFFTRRSMRKVGEEELEEPVGPELEGEYARRLAHEMEELDS